MNAVNTPDVAELSYEQARDELVEVVGRLESGAANLEDSLALWERGEALADRCQRWLDAARDRLAAAKGDVTVSLVEPDADVVADSPAEADEDAGS
ncbi:exodeoxyribonuclease VII small subunit [Occultella glacieicola]|uniref:Exodeoxyribonuclease 7 small subunit n=1 Tax=Occultella glacieicola TaxID=2518684 RepID=A0ABY2E2S6_9MICO|nr:exodeoxyribonuclease VII small subunit [Occultella glacieicola]TDE93924.1 exodeoxyribonuclease VII small subunit [Occultella glacieicola]